MNIGLDPKTLQAIADLLAKHLADDHVLYIKIRNFHWNLVGHRFHTLHLFFEEQYKDLEASIDEIAERIRTMGGTAPGSMEEFLKLKRLTEVPGAIHDGEVCIQHLLDDHEALARLLRADVQVCAEELKDAGTADFLTKLLEKHEKTAWMLRSFLIHSRK